MESVVIKIHADMEQDPSVFVRLVHSINTQDMTSINQLSSRVYIDDLY
jgi:hypothetical protein